MAFGALASQEAFSRVGLGPCGILAGASVHRMGVNLMLLFIDDSRTIKIARQADNGPREVLGKVKKHDLVLPEDVLEHLSPEEIEEVEGVFDVINDGETHRIKAAVAQFPTTVREVLTYYRESASPVEQRWILGALLEGLRVVRRHDRQVVA